MKSRNSPEDDFRRKEDAGNGRVEDTGDPAGAAGRDIDLHPLAGYPGQLADLGTQRTADLSDRPLNAGRVPRTDGQRSGDDFYAESPGPDNAVLQVHLAQELGKTVAVDLAGKQQRQRDEQGHAAHRQKRQQKPAPAALADTEKLVAVDKDILMDQLLSFPENNNGEAGHDTDTGSGDDKPGILPWQERLPPQFGMHVRSGMSQPMAPAWRKKKSSVMPAI